jgi:hypothetical protein
MARMPPTLTIPASLHPIHASLLREHHFETAGALHEVLRGDAYQGMRVIYAITNPARTEIVYIGDTEVGRDVRGRLKAHVNDRSKMGHVERDSLVFVHVMVTEYMVLDRFQQEMKTLPLLNNRKVMKHTNSSVRKRNDASRARVRREQVPVIDPVTAPDAPPRKRG